MPLPLPLLITLRYLLDAVVASLAAWLCRQHFGSDPGDGRSNKSESERRDLPPGAMVLHGTDTPTRDTAPDAAVNSHCSVRPSPDLTPPRRMLSSHELCVRQRRDHAHERHPQRTRAPPHRRPSRRRPGAHRRPAQARQADRARAHRPADGRGLVRRVRHVRRAPLDRLRHGEDEDPRRRRRHRLGHHQRPRRLCVRQGLHRVRRLAQRNARQEDHEDPGHGAAEPRADHRPVRCRRRAHPGRRRSARRLWRSVPAQRARLRRHSADFRHHGPVRRRRRLFARHDRLHLHGQRHELHVRHRPRRREDRDQRNRDGGRTRRRQGPHDQDLDRRSRLRERRRSAAADAPADGFPAEPQSGGRAGAADQGRARAASTPRSTR